MNHRYIISNILIDEVNKLFQSRNIEYTLDPSSVPLYSIIETNLNPEEVYNLFQSKVALSGEYVNDYIPVIRNLDKTCNDVTKLMISNRAKFIILDSK